MIKLEQDFEFGFSRGGLHDRRVRFAMNFRCYGGKGGDNASPQSTTTQEAFNYQVAAAPGAAAIGANSSNNTVNVTNTDEDVANAAIVAGALDTQNEADLTAHLADISAGVADTAIGANTVVAQGAIGVAGSSLALVAQNDASTAAEINTQTALAFSTIDHLITGQTAGQEAAANDAAALQLAAANNYGANDSAGANAPAVIYSQAGSPAPTDTGIFSTKNYNIVWIAVGAATLWYFFRTKKI